MRPKQEYTVGALCHLFNPVPFWGLLFSGLVWFRLREESREVVYHARQAMLFHGLLMLVLFLWCLVGILCKVVAVLSPTLALLMAEANNWITLALYVLYLGLCLFGFYRCMNGQPFSYPVVGKRT